MRNIFLSFTGSDRDVKNKIKEYLLEQNKGYNVLESDEECCSNFSSECIELIDKSQIFVAIVSKQTMEGSRCINEIIHARKRQQTGHLNMLLFKLFDGAYTNEFEFWLNDLSDLNNLYRGTDEGFAHLASKIEYCLEWRENGKPQYDGLYNSIECKAFTPIEADIYRASEIEQIHSALEKSNVVFLQGAAGMGKTHIAAAYLGVHKNLKGYKTNVKGVNLKEFILSVRFENLSQRNTDPDEAYTQTLKYLKSTSPEVLIVGEDILLDDLDGDMVNDLKNIGAKMLITTTENPKCEDFPVVRIDALPQEALFELFFREYKCNSDDRQLILPYLPKLIGKVGEHTGALVFIAKRFNFDNCSADVVIEDIQSLHISNGESAELAEEAIAEYFHLEKLMPEEQDMLFCLALRKYSSIEISDLRNIFQKVGIRKLPSITSLNEKGYIQADRDEISTSYTIDTIVLEQIEPSETAIKAVLYLWLDEFGISFDETDFEKLERIAKSYPVPFLDWAVECITLFGNTSIEYGPQKTATFLKLYSRLTALPDEYAWLLEWTDAFLKENAPIDILLTSEESRRLASELGLSDRLQALEEKTSPDLMSLTKGIKMLLNIKDSLAKNPIEGLSQLNELSTFLTESVDRISELSDDDDEISTLSFLIPMQTAMMTAVSSNNYRAAIHIFTKFKDKFPKNNPACDNLKEQILLMVFLAYQRMGDLEQCRQIGDEIFSLPYRTIMTDYTRKTVDLALLDADIGEQKYEDAKPRVERLAAYDSLSVEESLYFCVCLAHVQMFNGDWYRLRDYIGTTLERYRGVKLEDAETLRERLEECNDIISAIEGSADVVTNDREIMSVESSDEYRKYIKKQVGGAVFKSCETIVSKVLAADLSGLSDTELRAEAAELSKNMQKAKKQDDAMLARAFALAREAGHRVLGIKHHMIQLFAAALMVKGYSAQMRNGEGKTYTIVPAAAALALMGRQVDIISSSAYLASRDCDWMGEIYRLLGISVCRADVLGSQTKGYQVVYWAADELIFKQIRDRSRFVSLKGEKTFDCAIIDEADIIMIDNLKLPYCISSGAENTAQHEKAIRTIYRMLQCGQISTDDYAISQNNQITIFNSALEKLSITLGFDMLDAATVEKYNNYLWYGIYALFICKKDVDYYIRGNEVYMENTATGLSKQASGDLLSFLICKERLEKSIKHPTKRVYASLPCVAFKKYKTLIGVSGTMMASSNSFKRFYGMECIDIPTNKKICRVDRGYALYSNTAAQLDAIVQKALYCASRGMPVLVVAPDIKRQLLLEEKFKSVGADFNTVDYRNEEKAAEIFAVAGISGTITISTNIAGRGVDIVLGGNPKQIALQRMLEQGYTAENLEAAQTSYPTDDKFILMLRGVFKMLFAEVKELCDQRRESAIRAGGLCVIGTFLMQSLRHEEQICGRAGRQGEPGESEFIVSIEDESFSLLIPQNTATFLLKGLNALLADSCVEYKILTRGIKNAQIKREEVEKGNLKKNTEIPSELCDKLNTYVQTLYNSDELLAKKIIEVAQSTKAGDLGYEAAETKWHESISKLLPRNKKSARKAASPTLEAVLDCFDCAAVNREMLYNIISDISAKRMVELLEYCDAEYNNQTRLAKLSEQGNKQAMTVFHKTANEQLRLLTESLIQNVCSHILHIVTLKSTNA